MSPESETDNLAERPDGSGTPPARPPRPRMSNLTPAPVPTKVPPTVTILVSRYLWLASFVAGMGVLLFAFLARNTQIEWLTGVVEDIQPDQDAGTLKNVATFLFWASLVAVSVVVLVEGILVRRMMHRHGAVRWAIFFVLLVHAAVALLADAFLVTTEQEGLYLRILLVAQLLLAVAAFLASLMPGAWGWFRAERHGDGHHGA
jgi:hypothetical protein